jgi:retinol-binding protein 3
MYPCSLQSGGEGVQNDMISKLWFRAAALACLVFVEAGSVSAQISIPSTPAGQTLQTWLDAFNSGDKAKDEAYVKNVDPNESVDGLMSFRKQTGGFELLSIESSEPMHIRFMVKEKNSPTVALGNLVVKDGHPAMVAMFGLRALPPGAKPESVVLDAAARKQVIDGISSNLKEYYIDAALADKMSDALADHATKGDYNAITDGDTFADRLTQDLRAISHDKHLGVGFNPFKTPPDDPSKKGPSPEDEARFHKQMEHDNCAFEKVEILENNIGYVKFNGFMDAGFCGPTVVAAMGFIAHTDAIIFDIRQNGGGQPAMVAMIASYLFDHPTHLIDIYNRKEQTTSQNWTQSYLPGVRLATQPVYVLTSSRTFSGAEEFAFDLKNQKRATIVGEVTGGGAHPTSGHKVGDYFTVGVPFAKSLDPVTKTNWEGTGVEPDVKVPAAQALEVAEKLAVEKIHSK